MTDRSKRSAATDPEGGAIASGADMQREASGVVMGPGVVATETQAKGAAGGVAIGLIVGTLLGVLVGTVAGGGLMLIICTVVGAVAGLAVGFVAGGATRPMRELDATETSDH